MRIVCPERLECRYVQGVLLKLLGVVPGRTNSGDLRCYHCVCLQSSHSLAYVLHFTTVRPMTRHGHTILSPATMNVLVASPLRYTGPRFVVRRLYLSFGSSSASSSSSSSESCSTLSSPSLTTFSRRDPSRAGVRGATWVESAAMLAT